MCVCGKAHSKVHGLTFRGAAYGVVSIAPTALFEVRTRCASISGGNRHLATPFFAANSTLRCA